MGQMQCFGDAKLSWMGSHISDCSPFSQRGHTHKKDSNITAIKEVSEKKCFGPATDNLL